MGETERKVVQTELPTEEYDRFRRVVDERDLSVKEAVQEAIREYTDENMRYDPDDPIFGVEPYDGGEPFDAADADDLLADAIDESPHDE